MSITLSDLKKIIREVKEDVDFYEAKVYLESDRGRNLTLILDQLRGVCGITIVGVTGPAQPLSELKERTELRVKFLPTSLSLKQHMKKMKVSARRVPGVYSFHVVEVHPVSRRGEA